MRKLVHVKKELAKHVDKQIQVICHSIADLGFYETKVTKHSFIVHASQHLEHGNIYQLNIFLHVAKKDKNDLGFII
jgi:hypothetical protein